MAQVKTPRRLLGSSNRVLTHVLLILLGIGIGLISMMLGASHYGMPMFYAYFSSPLLLLLNILPPLLLLYFTYYISGRVWIGFLAASLIVLLLTSISYFKIQIRSDPFIASDFQLAGEADNMMASYTLGLNWKIYLAAAYIACGTVFSVIIMRLKRLRYKPRGRTRIIASAVVLLFTAVLFMTVYTNNKIYETAKSSYNVNIWNKSDSYITRGFVYPFINSFKVTAAKPPEDYSSFDAKAALSAYGDDLIPADKKVNVVSIMLESYADLSTLKVLDFNEDVYGPLHKLQSESLHGSLVDNIFAGGTINTERSFLTGFTEPGDLLTRTNSYVYYLKDQGYYTEGYHAGDSWFYDRNLVNPNIGFDHYYFLEDFKNAIREDSSFFPKVRELYDARDESVPYFSYNLSYQGHGPYDDKKTVDTAYIKQGTLSDASYDIINNYLSLAADTTRRVSDFVDSFRDDKAPVVIVIFGDHKPWLGNGYSAYNELGVNIDLTTTDGFYNFYKTPYIIWANDAAKKILGNDFTGDGGDFSPCFLMNKVFEACSWDGNRFMKAANVLRSHTSIVNTATGYFSEDGKVTAALSYEADDVYKKFLDIEYYWQHNFVS